MNDALHPLLEPIAFLLGTWRGGGSGHYPSIDNFTYTEEMVFGHSGKPVLVYSSKTRNAKTGLALHAEAGYWRPQEGGLEVVLAHSFGVVEIMDGTIDGTTITLRSKHFQKTDTAKTIVDEGRVLRVDGDVLSYEMQLAFGEHELQPHLEAQLNRL